MTKLSQPDIAKRCKAILKAEGADIPNETLEQVISGADGDIRQSLNQLELLALPTKPSREGKEDRKDFGSTLSMWLGFREFLSCNL